MWLRLADINLISRRYSFDPSLRRNSKQTSFTWVPVTFSFSFTKKELAGGMLTAVCERLGPLDIKALNNYEPGVTSHLIVSKRNTAKGLQALIDGRYIVQYDNYLKAVVVAATRSDPEAKSPLEEDWDANFPDPLQYLPPRGEEPTERGEDAYSPNPARKNMFEGYTFIFCHKNQFNTLLAPITEGGGKALLREVLFNQTDMNDFIRYVKEVAGEKGLGSFDDGSEGKGVVVVRYNPSKGDEQEIKFHNDFNRDVSLHLDHRLIEQNEFLDAILGVDARVLRRPLEVEASGVVPPPPTAGKSHSLLSYYSLLTKIVTVVASQPAPLVAVPPDPLRKKSRFRKAAAPKFKGFDSDDDDTPMETDSVSESMAVYSNSVVETQSQGLFMTQDPNWDISKELSGVLTTVTRSTRSRIPPPVQYDDENEEEDENIMDRIAPAATAIKKRKQAEDAAKRQRGESLTPPPPPSPPPAVKTIKESLTRKRKATPEPSQPAKKIKKETKETIYAAAARERMERAEELARANRGFEDEDLSDINPEDIRKLTIIETMEVRRKEPTPRAARADESDRWDDTWNGRKNFKKFRRRGGEDVARTHRVIVPLQSYKKKEYGVGEEYWLETESSRKKDSKAKNTQGTSQISQAKTKSQAKSQARSQSLDSERAVQTVNDPFAIPSSASESDEPQPASKTRATRSTASQSSVATKKRGAAAALTKPAPAKKPRVTKVVEVEDSDEDSEDEGKFRFGRRR